MEKQFCEVCLDTMNFERVYLIEEVTVKGETFEVDHEYDKCENCNELFEPIEDVDKNIKNDYRVYREKVGYIQPEEIKQIREKYGMSLRQFSELLGIGFSTLHHIEKGSLQTKYQNSLFVLVKSPQAMNNLLNNRLEYTEENYDGIKDKVFQLFKDEEKHIFDEIERISETQLLLNKSINDLLYENSQTNNNQDFVKKGERNTSWVRNYTSLVFQS